MLKEEKTLIFEWEIVSYSPELTTLAKADHQLQILLPPAQHPTSKMRIFLLPPFPISSNTGCMKEVTEAHCFWNADFALMTVEVGKLVLN